MTFNIRHSTNSTNTAEFLAETIKKKLESGKQVLLFLTGGSGVKVGVKVVEILNGTEENLLKNLVVTLTDERYVELGHKDSNWQQLLDAGFVLKGARPMPVLAGENLETTTKKFSENLNKELEKAQYKIGLFGVGKDGHTAGILPESVALSSTDMASSYDTPVFPRITMTPLAIAKLDEAVVFMQGEEKWKVLESLKENCDIIKMPSQILKQVPLLTIFTDKQL